MSIEVNGVQYEGILFAKLADEGYIEAKPAVSHKMEKTEVTIEPKETISSHSGNEITVAPTSPVENAQSPQT